MIGLTKCRCARCNYEIKDSIKWIAESIEREIGQQLDITSGARCPEYNKTIKGSIAGDSHEKCEALDIFVDFGTPQGRELGAKIVIAASKAGIKRFGIGSNLIHIDCVKDFPSPRMWLYFK